MDFSPCVFFSSKNRKKKKYKILERYGDPLGLYKIDIVVVVVVASM